MNRRNFFAARILFLPAVILYGLKLHSRKTPFNAVLYTQIFFFGFALPFTVFVTQ